MVRSFGLIASFKWAKMYFVKRLLIVINSSIWYKSLYKLNTRYIVSTEWYCQFVGPRFLVHVWRGFPIVPLDCCSMFDVRMSTDRFGRCWLSSPCSLLIWKPVCPWFSPAPWVEFRGRPLDYKALRALLISLFYCILCLALYRMSPHSLARATVDFN